MHVTRDSWSQLIAKVNEIRATWDQEAQQSATRWTAGAPNAGQPIWSHPAVHVSRLPNQPPQKNTTVLPDPWNTTFQPGTENLDSTSPFPVSGDFPEASTLDKLQERGYDAVDTFIGTRRCLEVCSAVNAETDPRIPASVAHSNHTNHRSHGAHSAHSSHGAHAAHDSHTNHQSHQNHGSHSSHSDHSNHSAHSSHINHTNHNSHGQHTSHGSHRAHTASYSS